MIPRNIYHQVIGSSFGYVFVDFMKIPSLILGKAGLDWHLKWLTLESN